MHRLHGDPTAYIAALEDPKRDAYQKPHEVLQALRLRSGEVIADIGAGSGYFALRLAHHVGSTGHVYAVDISPDMIRRLNERIHEAGLVNIFNNPRAAEQSLAAQARRSISRRQRLASR